MPGRCYRARCRRAHGCRRSHLQEGREKELKAAVSAEAESLPNGPSSQPTFHQVSSLHSMAVEESTFTLLSFGSCLPLPTPEWCSIPTSETIFPCAMPPSIGSLSDASSQGHPPGHLSPLSGSPMQRCIPH
jgi:hypothetical protein